jgi:dimethylhistidine N-methyltransferase
MESGEGERVESFGIVADETVSDASLPRRGRPRHVVTLPRFCATLLPVVHSQPDLANRELADHVLAGLTATPKRLSSRWFYDERGSELFAKIMDTEAYYPTRCEWEILHNRGAELLGFRDMSLDVVDLGAGDGRKTETILRTLLNQNVAVRYVPIDVSGTALAGLRERMAEALPTLAIAPIEADFLAGLRQLRGSSARSRLVLFLGSNIGNFPYAEARTWLRGVRAELEEGDHLLVGFDLKKDVNTLLRAYNDPEGYTREFNLNLLDRLNRELQANFDRDQFQHYGTYNATTGAMESYLLSRGRQQVHIGALNLTVTFEAWEPLHTEYSHKYLSHEAVALGRDSGYTELRSITDERRWFLSSLWRATKPEG